MKIEESILCIGQNQRNQELLAQVLNKAGYEVAVGFTLADLSTHVKERSIWLVLLDISGFDPDIWQACHKLHSSAIPFFIIAPPHAVHLPVNCGASGPPLVKPLAIRQLLTLIAHTLTTYRA